MGETVFITEEHMSAFSSTVSEWMSKGFDIGFEKFQIIVGIAALVIIVKIVVSKIG